MHQPSRIFVHCLTCGNTYHYRKITRRVVRRVNMLSRMEYETISKLVLVKEIPKVSPARRPIKLHKVSLCPACEGQVLYQIGEAVVGCRKRNGQELSCSGGCRFVGWACSANQAITLRAQQIKDPVPMRKIDNSHAVAKASSA